MSKKKSEGKFVLSRGDSGMLYLYNKEVWEYMKDYNPTAGLEFVIESEDKDLLRQMQCLVNKDIKTEIERMEDD